MSNYISPYLRRTLEEIENDFWGDSDDDDSYLIKTVHKLRRKKIEDFETEDLRIMIGQDRGLSILVPLALQKLEENILAEGDYYEGDLLKSVLSCEKKFWEYQPHLKQNLIKLFETNKDLLRTSDITPGIRNKLFEAFDEFIK